MPVWRARDAHILYGGQTEAAGRTQNLLTIETPATEDTPLATPHMRSYFCKLATRQTFVNPFLPVHKLWFHLEFFD